MRSLKKMMVVSLFILATACREKYVPTYNQPVTGFLVVEGFINSGPGPTTISLSRSTRLSDTATIVRETKATVTVEGKTNTTPFVLAESTPGVYTHPQLTLVPGDQYRVKIVTSKGAQYASDYSEVRTTVDIDSIAWRRENGGVQLYANAHDPQNKTRYYLYRFDETWEFHSTFTSSLKVVIDSRGRASIATRFPSGMIDTAIIKCWQNFTSYNILVASTEKLTQDAVSMFPVHFIEPYSWKLGVLYSINLKQYALSQRAFQFYELLRKNTQQLGSIFDAQPSENSGNIRPLNSANADETVLGFVEVTQERQKRIFISNAQVPDWGYKTGCEDWEVPNMSDSLLAQAGALPTSVGRRMGYIFFAPQACVDCTLRGKNTKPSFWP